MVDLGGDDTRNERLIWAQSGPGTKPFQTVKRGRYEERTDNAEQCKRSILTRKEEHFLNTRNYTERND